MPCTGSDEASASPHQAAGPRPSPPETSQPGRGGTRRSGKARTRAGGLLGRATACAPAYSLTLCATRRGQSHLSSPHGMARHAALRRPRLRGGGSPSPHGGSEERRAGPDGRRVRVRVLGDRRRPRAHSALRSLPRPADTVDPARPLHCVESCMEMEAQGFTSNPTDLCLCPSQSVCLSVRSVHPFSLDDGRAAIHHRSWPAACTSAPRPNRKHRTFPSHVKTRRRLSVGHGVRSCIVCHHLTWSTINTDFSERVRALCALHICTGPMLRAPHSCFGTCFRTMTMLSYTRESLLLQEDGADGGVSWHGSKNFALSG